MSNNKRQENKEFKKSLKKYESQYAAAEPYSQFSELDKDFIKRKEDCEMLKHNANRKLIKGFIALFNSDVLLEKFKLDVAIKGQHLLDLLDQIEKGELGQESDFNEKFIVFRAFCDGEILKHPSTRRPIIIPLKEFSDGVSIRLLTDLINDENRQGVVIKPKRHGVRQPKTLYDFFRDHREKIIMPVSYVLRKIIIEDGGKLKLAIPKDTIILRGKVKKYSAKNSD